MKIFVSGTSADLAPFREAVRDELQQLDFEVVEQGYLGVDYRKLPALLKGKLKRCDAVMCLVGSVFGAAPAGSTQSYTQLEYEYARELGKPIFLFLPSPECELDEGTDTPEQRELQAKHVDRIRASSFPRHKFSDDTDLRRKVSHAAHRIIRETGGGPIAQTVKADFPAPLSRLYDDCAGEDGSLLWVLVTEWLRFVVLLALHDSMVNRIFGSQSADRDELSPTLARPESLSDWRSLLRLACPDEGHGGAARFIPKFDGWARENSRVIDRLVQYDHAMSQRDFGAAERMESQVRQAMTSMIVELEFLKRYALLAVTSVDAQTGHCTATVLRGLAARSLELAKDPQSAMDVRENELYLLDVDRRRALRLGPSFRYAGAAGDERVCGLVGLHRDVVAGSNVAAEQVTTTVKEFGGGDKREAPEPRETICDWLGEDLCQAALGFTTQAASAAWQGTLLVDESWNRIREIILPGVEPMVLGARFRLADTPIHRGRHADVFEATDIASTRLPGDPGERVVPAPAQPVVHVLRDDSAADDQVCEWFNRRSEYWLQMQHGGVLRLHELGDPAGKTGRPFLVTDRVPGSRSLDRLMPPGEPVPDGIVMRAVTLAAEVCRAAHQQDIFLLALPPRHLLMDAGDNLFVTGFDTAAIGKTGAEVPLALLKKLGQVSTDVELMAPEMQRGFGTFARTLDVFAIGRLLAELRRLPPQAMDVLPTRYWDDPWQCLAYHCLATDPNVRFQSADQILMFLAEWPGRNEPRTAAVRPSATEPGFSMGTYPVTNAEYQRFCAEREYPPPPYLRQRGQQEDEQRFELSRRLSGPWLPVTCVSLLDAEAYCRWLTEQTHRNWRLPAEAEWRRAASCRTGDLYPWGHDAPDRNKSNYGPYYRGPTVVGTFSAGRSHANCWDMAGNVWEWCTDIVGNGAPRRVVKGGAYDYSADMLQLESGDAKVVTCRSPHVGFRVVCEERP
jgi:serine/threonine-protein kinase